MRILLLISSVLLMVPGATARPAAVTEAAAPALSRLREGCSLPWSTLRSQAEFAGPPGARAAFLLAHCLDQAGRSVEAAATFDAVAQRYPPLASYAAFRAAVLTLKRGAATETSARLADLLAGGISPPLARRAALLRAEALIKADSPAEAARTLRALLATLSLDPGPEDETFVRAWWLLGTASGALRDRSAAVHAYAMVWWGVPENSSAPDAARQLRQLTGGLPEPPSEARAHRGIRLLHLGERAAAVSELVAALHGPLPPALAANAWYHLGQARLRTPGGVYAFTQAARFPDGAARARYWLGRALTMTGRSREARAVWTRVAQEFPRSPWAARSLLAFAASVEGSEGWPAADRVLADLARRFPESRQADDARWRRAWVRYRLRKFAEAEALFTRAVAEFPSSRRTSASLFWAAQARRHLGGNARPLLERLAQQYPLTYYGQRARSQLGLPAPLRPPAAGPRTLSPDRFFTTHEELAALGFDREAADEAEALPESTDDPALLRFIALHRARSGEIAASVEAAVGAIEAPLHGGVPADLELWTLAYPRAYWESVRAASAANRVDPYLVLALIREESRFDLSAASPAGAIGLMQLLPSTAAGLAGRALSRSELRDPDVSVRYGVTYLSGALARFDGDRILALAAYNAGPGGARRIARRRGNDLDLWIETIPISETRGYVQRVLESYGIYRWLYR